MKAIGRTSNGQKAQGSRRSREKVKGKKGEASKIRTQGRKQGGKLR